MKEIISHIDPKSPIAEAYKNIRTNIEFANIDKNLKTIVVTSAQPGEGKSTTIANVAVAFAGLDKKVLLIDCDLRKPSIHKKLNLSNAHGLTDSLIGTKSCLQCINYNVINGLDVLTSGQMPPNPSELLSSKKIKDLIKEFEGHYDYVLIDAPPIGAVTDAAIISSYVDGVILVCASGEVDIEVAQIAKERLDKVNAKLLGVVLNKFAVEASKYYGYYAYYYGENDKKLKKRKK